MSIDPFKMVAGLEASFDAEAARILARSSARNRPVNGPTAATEPSADRATMPVDGEDSTA